MSELGCRASCFHFFFSLPYRFPLYAQPAPEPPLLENGLFLQNASPFRCCPPAARLGKPGTALPRGAADAQQRPTIQQRAAKLRGRRRRRRRQRCRRGWIQRGLSSSELLSFSAVRKEKRKCIMIFRIGMRFTGNSSLYTTRTAENVYQESIEFNSLTSWPRKTLLQLINSIWPLLPSVRPKCAVAPLQELLKHHFTTRVRPAGHPGKSYHA